MKRENKETSREFIEKECMQMKIKQEDNLFYIEDSEGNKAGEVTFVPDGEERIVIDHTFVSPEHRGQGLANKLVKEVVQYARENGKKIVPACSFAQTEFKRVKDYSDVLAK
ncbi:GNAT family N-acetyltransferase [Pradoshia sp.]